MSTVDARFEDTLADRIEAELETEVTDLESLDGGRSGHTWSATLRGVEPTPIVIKAGSPGRPPRGRHDMERQGRVMAALADLVGVAVPDVLAIIDGDPQVLVTTRVPGECCEPAMDGCEHLAPHVVEVRARAAARMLGHLHAADPVDIDLAGETLTVAEELERWTRVMRACDPELVPGAEDVIAGLARSIPAELPPRLVHGDYRLGNLLCGDEAVHGIIDWEIWSFTDPRIDLGWFLLFTDPADWPGVAGPMAGMPDAATLLAEYADVMGPQAEVAWFVAFGRMKMAAITGHNLRRHREGRRHDPTQERFPRMIARMLERANEELD